MGLKDQILIAIDGNFEDVVVPEWGTPEAPAKVQIRELSMLGWRNLREFYMDPEPELAEGDEKAEADGRALKPGWSLGLLAACMHDPEDGTRPFDWESPADMKLLEDRNTQVLNRLVDLALRLNGLSVKSVKEAEKNSPETSNSETASPTQESSE